MGGSRSSDVKETNITTTTETTMRDVGLTGQNAVDMAAILETGGIESTRISAASLDTLMQTVGKTSQQLIGGASDLVRTQAGVLGIQGEQAAGVLSRLMSLASDFSRDILAGAEESSEYIIGGAKDFATQQRAVTTGEPTDLVKIAPFIAIAAVAAILLLKKG